MHHVKYTSSGLYHFVAEATHRYGNHRSTSLDNVYHETLHTNMEFFAYCGGALGYCFNGNQHPDSFAPLSL